VTFYVEREGWAEAKRITVTRERIEIKSVSSRALPGSIGYLRINRFSHNTLDELKTHLAELGKKASRGLVLDLWNNPGGLLQQSVEVANAFLADGDIVITEGARGAVLNVRKAQPDKLLYAGPMVVLVNEGAASASEIVAGALKNLGRAVVMGESTFGKGTVQMLFENPDKSALKLTVAQYLTPGNVSIQTVGIVPDVFTNAVIVRKDWTRVHGFELDDRRRAKRADLKPARSQVPQRPAVRLDFLGAESTDAAKPMLAGETENAADPPLVELARTYLLRHAGTREEMLKRGLPFLQAWGAAQEKLVHQALAGRGVDWSPAPAGTATVPAAEVEARLEVDAGDKPVAAGAAFKLRLTVTNRSAQPVYRVHGFTDSPGHFLDERELLVGRLGPGESRTVAVDLKVPLTTLSSIQPVTLALRGANLGPGAVARARLAVTGAPRPRLTLTYRLHDDVKGNGDGRPEPGETVRLRVSLRNAGDGELTSGTVALRNLAGKAVFIEKGRFTVKQLAPGQAEEGDLTFRIQPDAQGPALKLELSAFDGKLREGVQGQIDLPLAPASATAPGLVGDLTPPRVIVQAAPLEVPAGTRSLVLAGEAVDETQVADVYVEVTNVEAEKFRQKQYYTSAPKGERRARLSFRATVPLWPGLNSVLVVARERGEVLGYQRLMVLSP
jgi:carboxyl-terminal processing protease